MLRKPRAPPGRRRSCICRRSARRQGSLRFTRRSKAEGEAACQRCFPTPSSCGLGGVRPEDDFFNRFAALARISPVLPLIGGGKTKLQPVFAGDVAKAVIDGLTGKAK